jgi:DNA invertase Pin-like site-specific DNA recombinase
MRIGIYTRKKDSGLPSLSWLNEFGFDSFEIYQDDIKFEYEDVTQREGLNMLLFDAEKGHLDALYVDNLKVISNFTVKVLETLLEFQKMNLALYFNDGCIKPDDQMIKHFHDQLITQWKKISEDSASINFEPIIKDENNNEHRI